MYPHEPIDLVDLVDPDPTPEKSVEFWDLLKFAAQVLNARLPPITSEAFFAHLSGYSHQEISFELMIPVESVKRHILRAGGALGESNK